MIRKVYFTDSLLLLYVSLWTSNSSSSTCARYRLFFAFTLRVLFILNPISYLNRFHLVFRVSDAVTSPDSLACAFANDTGCIVLIVALCAASMICWLAASYSVAMGLTASSEMEKDAMQRSRFVTVTEVVKFEVARLFQLVSLFLNVAWCFDVG